MAINIGIIKYFKTKSYLNKMYLLITIAICGILMIFSYLTYKNVEKTIFKKEDDINKKTLYQIKYNTESMYEGQIFRINPEIEAKYKALRERSTI